MRSTFEKSTNVMGEEEVQVFFFKKSETKKLETKIVLSFSVRALTYTGLHEKQDRNT
jgi:hypothetical protein